MLMLSLKNGWQPLYSSRKIPETCENSFVDNRIDYLKALLFNEVNHKDLNSATVYIELWTLHIYYYSYASSNIGHV